MSVQPALRLICGWHSKSLRARALLTRQYVCPLCHAQVGYFCVTPSSKKTEEHLVRVRCAKKGACQCRPRN